MNLLCKWCLAALAILAMAAPLYADDAEDRAVKVIEKLGGRFVRDERAPGKPIVEVSFPSRDHLIEGDIMESEFATVTAKDLEVIAGLKQLRVLNLWNNQVTDAGLKYLSGLKQLRKLNLGWAKVTDDGLKALSGLENLKELDLSFTPVTGAGLKALAGLTELESLELRETKVTDAGLNDLAGLKKLQSLGLDRTRVTGGAIDDLQRMLPHCKIAHFVD